LPDKINDTPKFSLHFHHAGLTDTGMLRDHNEDNYKLPVQIDELVLSKNGHLYVLADGMGGHQKGEVASAVTVEAVPTTYYAIPLTMTEENAEDVIINALSEAITKANMAVMEATEGGGTTVVTAVLYADLLIAMNVGDSRAYLLRDNELHLISRDHSLVSRLVEMGKITAEEALTHPRRNVLYQALGQGSDLEIHVSTERVQPKDVIILCSDGLWGEIDEADLKQVLNSAPTPHKATKQLIDLANQSGGPDNITAIIIHISDQEPPQEQETEQPRMAAPDDDTEPSLQVAHEKPNTLPEGKYHTDKS